LISAALAVQDDQGGYNGCGHQISSDRGQTKAQEADALAMPLASTVELSKAL
jgi:hypothetical protein